MHVGAGHHDLKTPNPTARRSGPGRYGRDSGASAMSDPIRKGERSSARFAPMDRLKPGQRPRPSPNHSFKRWLLGTGDRPSGRRPSTRAQPLRPRPRTHTSARGGRLQIARNKIDGRCEQGVYARMGRGLIYQTLWKVARPPADRRCQTRGRYSDQANTWDISSAAGCGHFRSPPSGSTQKASAPRQRTGTPSSATAKHAVNASPRPPAAGHADCH